MDVMAFPDNSLFKMGRFEDTDKSESEEWKYKQEGEKMGQGWLRVLRVGWEMAMDVDQDEV